MARGAAITGLLLVVVLSVASMAQGERYIKRRLSEVLTARETLLEVCVVPYSHRVRVELRLMVENIGSAKVVTAGSVDLRRRELEGLGEHRIDVHHYVDQYDHILLVLVDGEKAHFQKSRVVTSPDTHMFNKIVVLLRGDAEIAICEPATTTTTTTTTTSTTTTTPRPYQPPAPRDPTPTSSIQVLPPRVPVWEGNGGLVRVSGSSEGVLEREGDEGEEEGGHGGVWEEEEASLNTSEDSAAIEEVSTPNTEDVKDDGEWWDFVWLMGDFQGLPVLLLLIITLVAGIGLGAVTALLCEMALGKHKNLQKGHEPDQEFSRYTSFRTDQRRKQATPPSGTLTNVHNDNETNHNNPMNFYNDPPCSSPPDTYCLPHDVHSERRASTNIVRDETLPLTYPLRYPVDPEALAATKLLQTFAGQTFGGQPYQESDYQ